MTGAESTLLDVPPELLVEAEKANRIRDRGPAFTDALCDLILGESKGIDERLIRTSFLQDRKIFALQIFHQSAFQYFLLG
jgi:hypothetical protein